MDVNLDEMTEEICERIADLKIKKIRIRERLKTIETKSEGLMSRWLEQLEAIEALKLLASEIASRNRELQTSSVEVSQATDIRAEEDANGLNAHVSAEPKEFSHEVEIETPPTTNSFKAQPDTRAGQETY